jgi:mannose-6-phosphate isomerase-like protein (cupin superfamily)
MGGGVLISQDQVAPAQWEDPARGSIAWKTLISGDIAVSDTLICGISILQTGDDFALHSHPQPEIYFGLEGQAAVYVDGDLHLLRPGCALFIPGGAVHGIPDPSPTSARWLYTFAADRFDQIIYSFLPK